MTVEEEAGFKVTSAKNGLGDSLEETELTVLNGQLKKIISDNLDVAYAKDEKTVKARAEGMVTFTLTYYEGDEAIEVEVPVEVKEVGVATRIEAEDQKVALDTDIEDLDFKVFDQHDLDITNTDDKYEVVVKDDENKKIENLSAKGTYTVEIVQKGKEEAIGSFKVTVVDVENVDYDEYFFEEVKGEDGKDIVLDVKEGKPVKEKTLTLKGIKDGVTVVADDLTIETEDDGLYLKSSDEDIFNVEYKKETGTVEVKLNRNLKKAATAKVQLINKMGSIEIVEAELELEVVNTTPQIDKLTLGEEEKVVVVDTEKDTLKAALKELLTDGKEEDAEDKFVYDNMVEDITFIPGNNIVEVKIKDIYGGKVFRFEVEVDEDLVDPENGEGEVTDPENGEGEVTEPENGEGE